MSTVTERVAAGAAYLDEHDPGWWRADVERAIDLDVLDLGEGDRCILGQRCPLEVLAGYFGLDDPGELSDLEFGDAYDAYSGHLSGISGDSIAYWARDRGFTLTTSDGTETVFDDLTAEWRRVIEARRSA